MRIVEHSSAFKRDYKREVRGKHATTLDADLMAVLVALANDEALAPHHLDHNLHGNWAGYRECHVKPNLLLIYHKSGSDILRLARLGSHSKLFE